MKQFGLTSLCIDLYYLLCCPVVARRNLLSNCLPTICVDLYYVYQIRMNANCSYVMVCYLAQRDPCLHRILYDTMHTHLKHSTKVVIDEINEGYSLGFR